ncbi:unnamed protein product [Paramecium sonneborni]|uniref:Uncharacterized protein n=1 Tax=Paramecium sonneborni TaxID=65129 RepID=A0A8S1JSM3_9CILI|nr:unnamed protein product [Paramecium sonneborni]
MASQSEEKDLIGSILSDDEIKLRPATYIRRKNLTLKSKEFNPEQLAKYQDIPTSNGSIISTGQVSQQKQRIFFLTQTSIEIQSQLSSALIQTGEQEFNCSADTFQCIEIKYISEQHLIHLRNCS